MSKIQHLVLILLAPLAAWFLSGLIHDIGQILAVVLLGGRVQSFQPFLFLGPPHLQYVAEVTPGGQAIIDAAGMAAIMLTGLLLLFVLPIRRLYPPVGLAASLLAATFLAQGLGFVILPLLLIFGLTLMDDAVAFTTHSGLQPVLVSAISLAVLALSVVLFLARTCFADLLWER